MRFDEEYGGAWSFGLTDINISLYRSVMCIK
jgi:hypothetical protein